jgi:hypothetical protein
MSVFSPLVLSQMLVGMQKGTTQSVDFGNIFQKSFDSKSPKVISQIQHAINNLHQPLKHAPPAELLPYQRWLKTAIDEYTLWKNAQKNPTRAPKFEGTLQDVAAVLAKPPEVQHFKNTAKQPGGFLTREEVQERWELEVKGGGGVSAPWAMAVVSNALCPGILRVFGQTPCCHVCIASSHLFLPSA